MLARLALDLQQSSISHLGDQKKSCIDLFPLKRLSLCLAELASCSLNTLRKGRAGQVKKSMGQELRKSLKLIH